MKEMEDSRRIKICWEEKQKEGWIDGCIHRCDCAIVFFDNQKLNKNRVRVR